MPDSEAFGLAILIAGLVGVAAVLSSRAVPILLGAFIVQSRLPGSGRLYDIIYFVVTFSVIVQGGTVPGWRGG
jgi:NhaP-type Na+/H+ and K+/H+ antiporter